MKQPSKPNVLQVELKTSTVDLAPNFERWYHHWPQPNTSGFASWFGSHKTQAAKLLWFVWSQWVQEKWEKVRKLTAVCCALFDLVMTFTRLFLNLSLVLCWGFECETGFYASNPDLTKFIRAFCADIFSDLWGFWLPWVHQRGPESQENQLWKEGDTKWYDPWAFCRRVWRRGLKETWINLMFHGWCEECRLWKEFDLTCSEWLWSKGFGIWAPEVSLVFNDWWDVHRSSTNGFLGPISKPSFLVS